MKVVHITPYYPPSIGGIARFVSGVVENTSVSADVQVISEEGGASENATIIPGGKGRFIIRVLSLLKKIEPDIVHCHSHWHMLAPAVVYKRFNKRVKVIFTFHTEPPEQKKGIKNRVFGRLLSNCDAVTFVSKALQETISSQLEINARQDVIYPGVSEGDLPEKDIEEFAEEFGTTGRFPILVFIGLLEWKKKVEGVKILLSAVESIRKDLPSVKLLIVGDGSRRAELEKTISDLNLSDIVTITGLVDNVLVPLSLSDLYVHISLQEGLPQSLLEAMSLGKPVVASRIGGMPEVVIDGITGILVQPDKSAVASGISSLLSDKRLAARLGEQAREFAMSNLSWEKIGANFLSLYSSSR
jgi:glycosyltransferase involved in cell wall biosynthesis